MSKTPKKAVKSTGATAGDVLVGVTPRNKGLLIKINPNQVKDNESGGRIQGSFCILDAGTGRYATGMRAVCEGSSEFDSADEFIALVSEQPECEDFTHALNANGLWRLNIQQIRTKILV